MTYATTRKGQRIRRHYNQAVIRYRVWKEGRAPTGATGTEWMLWQEWVQDRIDHLLLDRDAAIEDYAARKRSHRAHARNTKRRYRAAASAASGRDHGRELGTGEAATDASAG